MKKLYKICLTYCCLFTLTLLGNSLSVFAQLSSNNAFNSIDRGFGYGQNLKGSVSDVLALTSRKEQTKFTRFDGSSETNLGELKNFRIATTITTTWNGTSWDFGPPTTPNPPNVVINGNYSDIGFTCNDLLINPGNSFGPSSDVHVWGNCISNSTLTNGHLIFDSPSDNQSIVGTFNNITLNNSAGGQLNGATFLKGTLKLQVGHLETNGFLTVVSNAAGTGRIATIENGASISGEVNVQRFIPGSSKGWYFLASPVLGQVVSNWNDGFIGTPASVFIHNEGGTLNSGDQINGWEYPVQPSITVGRGYRFYIPQSFFAGGATLDNKGVLKTGDFSFNVAYTPTGFGGGGWNLLGNPYACELDWHSFVKTNIGGSFHVWNKDKYGSYSQGAGIGVNDVERYIPSHQAFFVNANSASPALSVTEASKPPIPQNPGFLRMTAATDPPSVARITLKNSAGNKDETAIRWMNETTVNFDEFYDANKFPHDGLLLYSLCNDGANTSIQARPFVDGESVNLGFVVKEEGAFSLTFKMGSELFENRTWYLRDNEFGMIFPIHDGYVHSFTVDDGILASNWRFSIAGVENPVANKLNIKAPEVSFVPNPANDVLSIRNAFDIQKISIIDLKGKEVLSLKVQTMGEIKVSVGTLKAGVYLVKAIGKTGITTHKLVID